MAAAARIADRRRKPHSISRSAGRGRDADRARAPAAILTRGGGRPGDALYVTGTIGAAGGRAWNGCRATKTRPARSRDRYAVRLKIPWPNASSATAGPNPGSGSGRCSAARERHRRAWTSATAWPTPSADRRGQRHRRHHRCRGRSRPSGARDWFARRGSDPLIAALAGGDDYELLFSVRPKSAGRLRGVIRESRGVPLTRIGELTKDPARRADP